MALPTGFATPEEYFEESLNFFNEFQNLYNYPNTEILVKNVLDHIHVQNLERLNIYDEYFNLETLEDNFVVIFFEKIKRLRVFHDDFAEDKVLEDIFDVPLSPKKKHEIVYLAKEIKESCNEIEYSTIVDFGSGLGYLDQLIYETTNFQVLGLECNESHYVGAKKRQLKYHENSRKNVKYTKHRICDQSSNFIRTYLGYKFERFQGVCLTGLHACGDLSVDALSIFLEMEYAKSLIMLPCCYHKMAVNDGKFKSFPLSRCMKEYWEKYKAFEYMKVPFLRLGSQPEKTCEKLENSVFNLLARATLELYARKNNCRLKRNKRKAVKTKVMDNNFESYIRDASNHGFTLIKNNQQEIEPSITEHKVEFNLEELRKFWRQIDDQVTKKAGIFILLQNYLQPVVENFILFDRLMYLKENNINSCKYKKIFHEFLSPRCLALIASK